MYLPSSEIDGAKALGGSAFSVTVDVVLGRGEPFTLDAEGVGFADAEAEIEPDGVEDGRADGR